MDREDPKSSPGAMKPDLGPAATQASDEQLEQIFNEKLSAWRRALAGLQERLCSDVVSVAVANREAINSDPLDWVREQVESFWKPRRAGLRNWVPVGCDPPSDPENPNADLGGWHAPKWMLSQLTPSELSGLDAMAIEEPQPPVGRLPLLHTTQILKSIVARIENGLFMVAEGVLDKAIISLASERDQSKSAHPYSLFRWFRRRNRVRLNPGQAAESLYKAISAINRRYHIEWDRQFIDSTLGLYAALHPASKPAPESAVQATPTEDAPKGFDGLGQKETDLSQYFDAAGLTDRQRECASMKWEYGLADREIARRLGLHHKTVQESLHAADKRLKRDQKFKRTLKERIAHHGSRDESD